MIKRTYFKNAFILFVLLVAAISGYSQDIPARPVPARLVNDFTGTLNTEEINALENKLVAFNDSTSTQIAIVMIPDLNGYDKTDYAVRLGNSWGIGQKEKNNGILILVKPKTPSSNGEAVIVTGYGAEGPVPDLACSDIVQNELLPSFRVDDYYGGFEAATSVLMSLISGEFTADQYNSGAGGGKSKLAPLAGLLFFLVIMIISSSGRNNHSSISRSGLPLWVLLGMMNSSGRSHSGSWGGFTSGGGGGGGFGGFGGGSFGGGGAGGSW